MFLAGKPSSRTQSCPFRANFILFLGKKLSWNFTQFKVRTSYLGRSLEFTGKLLLKKKPWVWFTSQSKDAKLSQLKYLVVDRYSTVDFILVIPILPWNELRLSRVTIGRNLIWRSVLLFLYFRLHSSFFSFSWRFLNSNYFFSTLDRNCYNVLNLRNLQDQVTRALWYKNSS